MQIVDAIVSREGANNAWAKVVFLGDRGESVSVRLPYPVPSGGPLGRVRLIKRAASLLRGLVEEDAFGRLVDQAWPVPAGRFGISDVAGMPEQWKGRSASGDE